MISLAFYKGQGETPLERAQDAAIRIWTGSPYSHVELIPGRASLGQREICLSSSVRDNGVRQKTIFLRPEAWTILHFKTDSRGPVEFIQSQIGKRYDFRGVFLNHLLPLGVQSRDRWFCSEICAAAIGLKYPHRYSPARLFNSFT